MYDVIVLGAGPGGYLAAQRAGEAKLKTLCIEGEHFGGTCLNEGCIPTKTLLQSGKIYDHARRGAAYGVHAEGAEFRHSEAVARKDRVVRTLVSGVRAGLKAAGVECVSAFGRITGRSGEGFTVEAGGTVYTGKRVIVATGSACAVPPIPGLREGLERGEVMTNKEALALEALPKSLAVLGGGVIGLELAAYFAMAGTAVTVVEMLDHIGGPNDPDLVRVLQKNCEDLGMRFCLNARVTGLEPGQVRYERLGREGCLEAERVLLAIGRKPVISGFGLEELGVVTQGGAVAADRHLQTNIPGLYAVGDVNGRAMLAHTAYREAEVAVHHILGVRDAMRYEAIPSVLYTVPELSSVGMTEAEARSAGIDCRVIRLPMAYSGRYVAENEGGDGLCKLVFDRRLDTLIGAQFLANSSSEFIAAAAICVELELTAEEIRTFVFPHPTVAEILREAVSRY